MTSDRHLNLMALMREIEAPTKTYQRSVRLAAALGSDTPQWNAAVERGTTALDHIDCAVRRWVTAHPEEPAEEPEECGDENDGDWCELEPGHDGHHSADTVEWPAVPAAVETGE